MCGNTFMIVTIIVSFIITTFYLALIPEYTQILGKNAKLKLLLIRKINKYNK